MQKSASVLNTLGCTSKIYVHDRSIHICPLYCKFILLYKIHFGRDMRASNRAQETTKSLAQWITFQIDILKLLRRSCNKTNVNASRKPQKAKETFNLYVLSQLAIRPAFSLSLSLLFDDTYNIRTILITLELKLIFFMEFFSVIKY